MIAIPPNPRSCGSCSLCCKLLHINESDIQKPAGRWCPHCKPGRGGCSIYADRPYVCRSWRCGWHIGKVPDHWHPAKSHLVLDSADADRFDEHGREVRWQLIYCDPGYPDAWRRDPYWMELRGWAYTGLRGYSNGSACWTSVRVGTRAFVILPDKAVEVTGAAGVFIREIGRERWDCIAIPPGYETAA